MTTQPVKIFLIPLDRIRLNDSFPDRDDSYIYDHLSYYCSLCNRISTIVVRVIGGSVVSVRNHKHVKIAAELGFKKVKVILESGTEEELLNACDQLVEVTTEPEIQRFYLKWHVLVFEKGLTQVQQGLFKKIVERCFVDEFVARHPGEAGNVHPPKLVFSSKDTRVEFQGMVPMFDHPWGAMLRGSIEEFNRNEVSVLSMNGLRWRFE